MAKLIDDPKVAALVEKAADKARKDALKLAAVAVAGVALPEDKAAAKAAKAAVKAGVAAVKSLA